jgi:hypothetical protein
MLLSIAHISLELYHNFMQYAMLMLSPKFLVTNSRREIRIHTPIFVPQHGCSRCCSVDVAVCASGNVSRDYLPEEWYPEQHRCENRKSQMNAVHIMFIVLGVRVSPKNPFMSDAWCSTSRTATIYGEALFPYLISYSGDCPSLLDVRDSLFSVSGTRSQAPSMSRRCLLHAEPDDIACHSEKGPLLM